jgi:hypothetical protein
MDQSIQDARRLLRSGSNVLAILGIVLLLWTVYEEVIPTLYGIAVNAPVLRVYPGSIGIPAAVFFIFTCYAALILRAIPISDSIIKKVRPWIIGSFWLMLAAFVFGVLIVSTLQHHYFPKNGYTECDQLQGAPSIWFTDWVKDPAWCVKGKDRKWVLEQSLTLPVKPTAN